jgi:TnpA family transposase
MPVQLRTEAERARRHRVPDVIADEDRVTFFTLSERDRRSIPRSREPHTRLGYALQLCTLRFMGFVPDDRRRAPPDAVALVAQQLAVAPHVLAAYGARAQDETFHQLTPIRTDACQRCLDTLWEPDVTRGMTPLAWLRRPPVSNSPKAIVANLETRTCLRATAVDAWSLAALKPNRLTFLAQLARKSSAQALHRAPAVRRYPLLVAFLVHALATVTDEVLEMFDRGLAEAYARAGKDSEDFRTTMAQAP